MSKNRNIYKPHAALDNISSADKEHSNACINQLTIGHASYIDEFLR